MLFNIILKVYARFRANSVHKSLEFLREQLKGSLTGSAANNYQGFSPASGAVSGTSTLVSYY